MKFVKHNHFEMKYLKFTLLGIFFLLEFVPLQAQTFRTTPSFRKRLDRNYYLIGVGFNAVDDSGTDMRDLLNIKENWNIFPGPSRFSYEKPLSNAVSLQGVLSYNSYKLGKRINNTENVLQRNFYSLDARAKFNLNYLFGPTGFFNPYLLGGLGFSYVNRETERFIFNKATFNNQVGIGMNFWLSKKIALNLESTGKFSYTGATSHYKQHAVSLIYRLNTRPKLQRYRNPKTNEAVDHLENILDKIK